MSADPIPAGPIHDDHDPATGALPFRADAPARTLEEAMLSRRSVRAFRPDPVPRATVERILALASRAPSGTNIQPWQVHVLAGEARARLAEVLVREFLAHGEEGWPRRFHYYPVKWRDPYLARRRRLGWALYSLLGIGKGEFEKTKRQHARNFAFFDAPVALVFTIDADLELGSWMDCGMFLQNVMLAARAFGLDTCPQAAIAAADASVRRELGLPDTVTVLCGMSLGHARADAVENTLVTEREPVAGFARFSGFPV